MADPFGIIGLTGIAGQVIQASVQLCLSWKSAPVDTRNFLLELSNLKTALEALDKIVGSNSEFAEVFRGKRSSLLSQFDPLHDTDTVAMVAACKAELEHLLKDLKKAKHGMRFGWERLKAACDGSKARETVASLQRRCNSLSLLFQADFATLLASTLQEVKEGREEQRRIHRAQTHALDHIREGVDDLGARQEQQAILSWLSPINFASQHNNIVRRRQPGTGQWFLNSDEFREWVSGRSQTLYCHGFQGAGKTVITSIVVENLDTRFRSNPNVGLAYVYCHYTRMDEQRPEELFANLLEQIARGLPVFPAAIKALYAKHGSGRTRPTLSELVDTFVSVAALFEERVFIAVDGLDEIGERDGYRTKFLSALFDIQSLSGSRVSLFATSRSGYPDIMKMFRGYPSLEIVASKEDIERYVRDHMGELGQVVAQRPDLQQEIVSVISETAGGMFLFAHLFFQSLKDKVTVSQIKKALNSKRKTGAVLPKDSGALRLLTMVYDEAMERINGQLPGRRELAKHVLSWTALAAERLSLTQIRYAWAVRDSEGELDEDSLPDAEEMVSVCAGLVTFDEITNAIHPVHYTTHAYLKQRLEHWFPDVHAEMARICTSYLCFKPFSQPCRSAKEFGQRLQDHPLYGYAARYWSWHASKSPVICEQVLRFLQSDTHVEAASYMIHAEHCHNRSSLVDRIPTRFTGLHLVAMLGFERACAELLARNMDPDAKDSNGRTPLSYAAEAGSEAVVRTLLATGRVDINSRGGRLQYTPLHYAALFGNAEVVEALLATGQAEVNRKGLDGETPLHLAVKNNRVAMVRKLLATNQPDTNKVNDGGMIPPHTGDKQAKTPSDIGRVDVNAKDNNGQTALHHAAISHAESGTETTRMLLSMEQVQVDEKDNLNRTPLMYAAWSGRNATGKALLDTGQVDVNATDNNDQTALHHASDSFMSSRAETVEGLLSTKQVDANAKDKMNRASLMYASGIKGNDTMRELLNTGGADANAKSIHGITALHFAADSTSDSATETAKTLRSTGRVEVNVEDENILRTPLSLAAKRGKWDRTRPLTNTNQGNINVRDEEGWAPLHHAAINYDSSWSHHGAEVSLATGKVELGAKDINSLHAPLSYAAENSNTRVVEALLATEQADVDTADNMCGQTPLACTLYGEHQRIAELLRKNSAREILWTRSTPPSLSSSSSSSECSSEALSDTFSAALSNTSLGTLSGTFPEIPWDPIQVCQWIDGATSDLLKTCVTGRGGRNAMAEAVYQGDHDSN